MDSREYWEKRERKALRDRLTEEQSYIRELHGMYDNMLDEIQKEIDSFYRKYAAEEGITIGEARKRVKQLDIEAYEAKAKQYVKNKDLSPQANREMRLYNLTMKVNRLEMLKARIGLTMVDSFDGMNHYYEEVLNKRAMDEYERQAGILGNTVKDAEKKARALVNASFKSAAGKYGFSDVLWTQQTFLKAELSKLLQQGIMQGKGPRELAPQLRKAFGVSKYAAERLMRTELARVQIGAQKQSFEANGYDEYQFITLSSAPFTKSKVCPICADLNGKHFKVKDMEIGENAPPMHPNCRCSIAAYMDPDEFEKWLDEQTNISANNSQNNIDNSDDSAYNNFPANNPDTRELTKQLSFVYQGFPEFIPNHTIIEDPIIIAGKGSNKKLRIANKLADRYKAVENNPDEWMKMVGTIRSDKYQFDIHWYECSDRIVREPKIKNMKERKK